MAKTTTIQKIRDKWAGLCGLDKDNIISDDAGAFLEFVNLGVDEAWLRAEWPFAMRITADQVDSTGFVDLSSDTGISEVLRAYDVNPLKASGAVTQYENITTVENADYDGVYIPDASEVTDVSVSTLTSSGTTATCTTSDEHDLVTGDTTFISGVDQSDYNGTFVVTVTSTTVFTYTMLADPAVDTATGTMLSSKAVLFLEHRIVAPEYTLVTDTPPAKLGTYLAYRASVEWYRGEGQEDKANSRLMIAEGQLLNEIERLERQMYQQIPTQVGVRISGIK